MLGTPWFDVLQDVLRVYRTRASLKSSNVTEGQPALTKGPRGPLGTVRPVF